MLQHYDMVFFNTAWGRVGVRGFVRYHKRKNGPLKAKFFQGPITSKLGPDEAIRTQSCAIFGI